MSTLLLDEPLLDEPLLDEPLLDEPLLDEQPVDFDEQPVDLIGCDVRQLPTGRVRMYAIAFDLEIAQLQNVYPNPSYTNAYADIRKILEPLGFKWQQGSVYFGGEEMNAVKCVLAAQAVSDAYPWFKSCVRDIRMLRIEELNDLAPAL